VTTVTVQRTIEAPASDVWAALTTSKGREAETKKNWNAVLDGLKKAVEHQLARERRAEKRAPPHVFVAI
jgi:hypothetical protein